MSSSALWGHWGQCLGAAFIVVVKNGLDSARRIHDLSVRIFGEQGQKRYHHSQYPVKRESSRISGGASRGHLLVSPPKGLAPQTRPQFSLRLLLGCAS